MTNSYSPNFTNNMPRIAVLSGWDGADYDIHPDYVSAILNAGGFPVFIGYDNVVEQLENANVSGVFLIGGVFNSPKEWYEPQAEEELSKRSMAYLDMIAYAKEHKLATLGICAGHQMIAGSNGAMLKKGINEGLAPEKSHKQNAYKIAHKVKIVKDSLLAKIIGQDEIETNSSHNEAIRDDRIGDCIITARAEDGIVEAIELKKPWHKFVLGIQWHPERLIKIGDIHSPKIFESFVKACADDK